MKAGSTETISVEYLSCRLQESLKIIGVKTISPVEKEIRDLTCLLFSNRKFSAQSLEPSMV